MKPIYKAILKWAVAIATVALILWWQWDPLAKAIDDLRAGLDPDRVVLAFGLAAGAYFFGMCCTFVRWWLLVRAQDLPFRIIDAVRLNFASLFFSIFLPGSIAGDLIKAGLLVQEQERRTIAIATIIVDRVIGLYGLFVLTSLVSLVLWFHIDSEFLRLVIVGIWAVFIAFPLFTLLVMLLPFDAMKWIGKLRQGGRPSRILAEVFYAFHMYRQKVHYVLAAVGLATLGHVGFVWSFYFSATVLPPPIPPASQHAIIIPIYRVVQSVPLLPGNLGWNEGAGEVLYRLVEPDPERPPLKYGGKGTLAVAAGRMVDYGMALLGLFFYLPLRATMRKVVRQQPIVPSVNGPPPDTPDPHTKAAKQKSLGGL